MEGNGGDAQKIVHAYFGINREAIWITVKERIPSLRIQIEQIIKGID